MIFICFYLSSIETRLFSLALLQINTTSSYSKFPQIVKTNVHCILLITLLVIYVMPTCRFLRSVFACSQLSALCVSVFLKTSCFIWMWGFNILKYSLLKVHLKYSALVSSRTQTQLWSVSRPESSSQPQLLATTIDIYKILKMFKNRQEFSPWEVLFDNLPVNDWTPPCFQLRHHCLIHCAEWRLDSRKRFSWMNLFEGWFDNVISYALSVYMLNYSLIILP